MCHLWLRRAHCNYSTSSSKWCCHHPLSSAYLPPWAPAADYMRELSACQLLQRPHYYASIPYYIPHPRIYSLLHTPSRLLFPTTASRVLQYLPALLHPFPTLASWIQYFLLLLHTHHQTKWPQNQAPWQIWRQFMMIQNYDGTIFNETIYDGTIYHVTIYDGRVYDAMLLRLDSWDHWFRHFWTASDSWQIWRKFMAQSITARFMYNWCHFIDFIFWLVTSPDTIYDVSWCYGTGSGQL